MRGVSGLGWCVCCRFWPCSRPFFGRTWGNGKPRPLRSESAINENVTAGKSRIESDAPPPSAMISGGLSGADPDAHGIQMAARLHGLRSAGITLDQRAEVVNGVGLAVVAKLGFSLAKLRGGGLLATGKLIE